MKNRFNCFRNEEVQPDTQVTETATTENEVASPDAAAVAEETASVNA